MKNYQVIKGFYSQTEGVVHSQLDSSAKNRPCSTDITHYIIALFSGYYLVYFHYMSGKRVVGSTAILEIRTA